MILPRVQARVQAALTFRNLRTRLAVLYAALFAIGLIIVAVVAQAMILTHARNSVRAELSASGEVYDRIWALRTKALSDLGWTILRFWNDDVLRDIDGVCQHIVSAAGLDTPAVPFETLATEDLHP